MNSSTLLSDAAAGDAELVAQTRQGDRQSFQRIVERYQSLVCALAYSGTGSLARSEEIVQETFLTAWRRLRELREPANLRGWLCGIARNLTRNAQRRAAREPTDGADGLEPDLVAADAPTVEQVIRAEEESLLWRTLTQIPPTYREPLVLYYREHRSVAEVAQDLALSEDAVKQRLSRGRAMLAEQVQAFVEGTLERTRPGAGFTRGVMSALPLVASSAAAMAGAKTSAGAKAATGTVLGLGAALMGLVGVIAGYAGWQMSDGGGQSDAERGAADRLWQYTVVATAATIVAVFSLLFFARHAWARTLMTVCLAAMYLAIAVPFAVWAWRNHVRIRAARPGARRTVPWPFLTGWVGLLMLTGGGTVAYGFASGQLTDVMLPIGWIVVAMPFVARAWEAIERRRAPEDLRPPRPGARRWVAAATVLMGLLLGLSVLDMGGWQSERVNVSRIENVIEAHPDARVAVLEYQHGTRQLQVVMPDPSKWRHRGVYFSPIDARELAALTARGVHYRVLKQGTDFEIAGTPGRMLFLLAFAVFIAGATWLIRAGRL